MRLFIVILTVILCVVLDSVQCQKWIHHAELVGNGVYNVYWNPPEEKRGDSEITFMVEVKTECWFALGFSPDGGLPGSDIVMGWIEDGEVYFQDRHIIEDKLPIMDTQQDYQLINAYENGTNTIFEFRRKLDTCDKNDTVIYGGTMRVIYAYSKGGPASDKAFNLENQGMKSLILLQAEVKGELDLDSDSVLQWEMRSPDIDLSAIESLYWCRIVKFPQESEKHHIVQVKAMIQEGNEHFIHHLALYECVGGTTEQFEDLVDDRGYECYQPNMPQQMFMCNSIVLTSVIGFEDIVYPEHVGVPVDPSTGKYFMFEADYQNPQLQTGIIDNSGLNIYYTSNLRKYDATNYLIGASISRRTFIPPRREKYVIVGHSHPDCSKAFSPESEVKAFAISLFSRSIARSMKVRRFRGNEELILLADDKTYDPYYQTYRYYPKEISILPNDRISIECTYNSSERSDVTVSGLTSRDESCLAILLLYPRASGPFVSFSAPSYVTINEVFNTNVTNEVDLYRVLTNNDWASADIDKVQNAIRYSKHQAQCYLGPFMEGTEYPLISYPDDLEPYEEEPTCTDTM